MARATARTTASPRAWLALNGIGHLRNRTRTMRFLLTALLLAACGAPARSGPPGIYVRNRASWPFAFGSLTVWMDGERRYVERAGSSRAALVTTLPSGTHVVGVDVAIERPCALAGPGRQSWRVREARRVSVTRRARLAIDVVGSTVDAAPRLRWSLVPIEGDAQLGGPAPWPATDEPTETFAAAACEPYAYPSGPFVSRDPPPETPFPPTDCSAL